MNAKQTNTKKLNLALQGGGAHGAFTWGVLDRLLEDERVDIEAISGTSAGAMNGVLLADGLMRDGTQGARAALSRFWRDVSKAARFSPLQRGPVDMFMGNWSLDTSPAYLFFDMLTRVAGPYELNPFDVNPLRDILDEHVDFELVRSCDKVRLYISATNVETGRVKVFDRHQLTCQMVMASACIPFMFKAVEIDGIPYWDGGYMGNPVLFPFFGHDGACDILIVQINPIERKGVPKTSREILNRVDEITFNASLLKELRSIDFVRRLLEDGRLEPGHYSKVNVHIVEAGDEMRSFGASSKLNAEWAFLKHLFAIGRNAADNWLEKNFDAIGLRSTVDLRAMFEGQGPAHQE
ncbi:MAG: patatin-like phospholipase family protein [Hyphomicrobiaceae bacterium]|nr:patatin-like phospholipase family protein [Hyphomicrobiaceae bacterium]